MSKKAIDSLIQMDNLVVTVKAVFFTAFTFQRYLSKNKNDWKRRINIIALHFRI